MATNANVIALPPDLIAAAEQYAQSTQSTLQAVTEEALRFYFDANPELNAIRQNHKQRAASMGLTPDEYVMQIVKEERAENRQRSA